MKEYWKKIKKSQKIIFTFMIAGIFFTVSSGIITAKNKEIKAKDWYNRQQYYIKELSTLATTLDNVTSLYINNNISAQDYYNHIFIIKDEFEIFKKTYNDEKNKYPVKTGTYDYHTKAGCEAVENTLSSMEQLIYTCLQNDIINNKDKLVYIYLAYQQEIANFMAKYSSTYAIIYYNDYMEE